MRGDCKICNQGAAEVVDKLLTAKTRFRDIAAQCGFSKSNVERHKNRCYVRQAARELKQRRFDPEKGRTIVRWPVESFSGSRIAPVSEYTYLGQPFDSTELTEHDCLITVEYEPALPPRPPPSVPEPCDPPATNGDQPPN